MSNVVGQNEQVVQVLPETSTDERMHVLDETCWCEPEVEYVPGKSGSKLIHRRP